MPGGFTARFVLWVELNTAVDVFKLSADAVAQHIAIIPGKIFSDSDKPLHCLHILFGKRGRKDMDFGLKLLSSPAKKQVK